MAKASYKDMSVEELKKLLESSRNELRELRFFSAVIKSLQNPSRPRYLRKTIARVLTELRAREIAAGKSADRKSA